MRSMTLLVGGWEGVRYAVGRLFTGTRSEESLEGKNAEELEGPANGGLYISERSWG